LSIIATAISFPWSVDPTADESLKRAHVSYYRAAYGSGAAADSEAPASAAPLSEKESFYLRFARESAIANRVPETIHAFVEQYALQDKKVLEVGAGSGLLQDLVSDYTGLDISPTARRFFHKPFVEASATDMPFPGSSFDAAWSVWVLEHIPNPERALLEIRRVLKPGGYLLLYPAFEVSRYVSQGYLVRPYSDFDWKGKLVKASIPIAHSNGFHWLQYHQIRMLRSLGARLASGPSRLHFIRLTPNYEQYWMEDSDATTSVSLHELYLWFTTRGDLCLNCPSERELVFSDAGEPYMIVQIRK
jgi:SAM-dependent methyltransferase